ncbi:ACP phosphodiesterase [Roseivirga pacifica]|uniref:acyl carrier protein phosphodiesterase n=1 Tax=Roseivirga pacifica TaxID=1267423 RepID=UPI003BA87F55
MNYLAHLLLSGEDYQIALGNFMGDFVKGKDFENYPDRIKTGILLHREIDRYTDSHDVVKQSKDRLREKYRHYSGVIIDVFYDHFLANSFQAYTKEPLHQFVMRHYENLETNSHVLPARAQNMLEYMVRGNWLENYKELRGIQKTLTGMSRRTKFNSLMDQAIIELTTYHQQFADEFAAFFPDIQAHATQYRKDLVNSH